LSLPGTSTLNASTDGLSKLPPLLLRPERNVEGTTDAVISEEEMRPMHKAISPSPSPSPSPENLHGHTTPPPPSARTPVSGDVLLPLLIFAVVKSNPPHLVSHLLFIQRFRAPSPCSRGEEEYCLVNFMAVAEFLENVDLAAVGLTQGQERLIRSVV